MRPRPIALSAGSFSARTATCRRTRRLGYRLRRDAWGRGYATEGSRALIEEAFQHWEIERIVARTLVGNAASRRVMEKCGLRFEEFFTYPLELIPGWTEEERAAVKYGLSRTEG